MIILHPVESVLEMLKEDIQEHPKDWLKFLFVESKIGWVIGGIASVLNFLVVSTLVYWVG